MRIWPRRTRVDTETDGAPRTSGGELPAVHQTTPPLAPGGGTWELGRPPMAGGGQAQLQRLMALDPAAYLPMSRTEMMRIPAVRRGRGVICGTIAGFPLRTYKDDRLQEETPALLALPERWRARVSTLTWTVDDLIFYPYAWWWIIDRDTVTGRPREVLRIDPTRVTWQYQDGTGAPIRPRAFIDRREVDQRNLIRIDGPDEGLLQLGSVALRTAQLLESSAAWYGHNRRPTTVLKYTGQGVLRPEDARGIREQWDTSREESETGVLSANMDAVFPEYDPERLQLLEARQYCALEASRLLGLPPRYVNATSGESMTYSNSREERRDLIDLSLRPYVDAIEQRLSMGDITPRGTEVRADMNAFLRGDPVARADYLTKLTAAGILDPRQAAEMENVRAPDTTGPAAAVDRGRRDTASTAPREGR